jgi:hypothetical protein
MKQDTETENDAIIDLDADQVIDHDEKIASAAVEKPKRRWPMAAAALLAGAVGGGWVYKDLLSDYLPSDQLRTVSERVVVLEAQNQDLLQKLTGLDKLAEQLKSDVDAMEGKEQAQAGATEALQKAGADAALKLAGLEQALADAKQAIANVAARPVVNGSGVAVDAGLQQRITNLEKDVASLKVKPAEAIDNTVALSQNLSDLKAKIAAGTGYRDEYGRIQRMVPAAAGLEILAQHAALGLPDAKGLAGELKTLIADLPKPVVPGAVPESQGWWAGIYRSLSDLITIKVEGDVDWPSSAAAAVALAESGDLPQAIEHLNASEAAKPAGLQQWVERVQARLSIEAAVQSVEESVLRVIAAKG